MGLQDELDKMRPVIRTDNYSMSIGELISLYTNNEIDIHPEFQRFYRWDDTQKTRFIESILLGIPIPPIFVSQRNDGVWDVVDGLQRLSTIYQFCGVLKNEKGNIMPPLVLERTKYLPSLAGKKWSVPEDPLNSFDTAQRMYIKRAKLFVNIMLRESGELAKYELFQRLNTGGSQLSDQEVRNCILVQINGDMFAWLRSLSEYPNFQECVLLTDRALEEQYDLELILRFVIFRKIAEDQLKKIVDLGEFLTSRMIELGESPSFNYQEEENAFKNTFDSLSNSTKENSFRKYNATKGKFVGGFLVTPFEVIALGLGYNFPKVDNNKIDIEAVIKKFWTDEQPGLKIGSGVSAASRIPTTIPIGRNLFSI